jgi:transmembrane sensor
MRTNFEQLLLKKLLGTITVKEEMDFNLWLKVNPAYDEIYMDRKREWEEKQLDAPEFTLPLQGVAARGMRHIDTRKSNSKRFIIANDIALISTIVATLLFFRGISVDPRKIVATDKAISVTLKDKTVISLKPHSTIIVPAGFPSKRTLELQGQAYFEVKPIPGKPLIINAMNSRIEVAGTSFVVLANEQKENEVVVFEGRVRLSGKQNANKNVIVTPGMRGKVVNQIDQPTLSYADTDNLLAFKTDRFTFRNSSLYDVAHIISLYYNVDVHLHDGLTGCPFTGTFDSVSLDEVLNAMRESIPVQITIDKETITIDGKECELKQRSTI